MKNYTFENITIDEVLALTGINNEYLNLVQKLFHVTISFRNNELFVNDDIKGDLIYQYYSHLLNDYRVKKSLDERDFRYEADHIADDDHQIYSDFKHQPFGKTVNGKLIYPKTKGQIEYAKKMNEYDVLFATGPAGTGKTYLSIVFAATRLKEGSIKKIILTRPAVEAGESLGFLPGDLKEKVDPYLQPLYDALNDTLGLETTEKFMEKGIIEVVPLAYMRGRTLDDAIIILDEAQNTTCSQMKMFLTRLGINSKMMINGDITQIDLKNSKSGLIQAWRILNKVEGIGFIQLTEQDVVRHPLVQKIIEAYQNENETDI